jgi:outer membrane protein TolC
MKNLLSAGLLIVLFFGMPFWSSAQSSSSDSDKKAPALYPATINAPNIMQQGMNDENSDSLIKAKLIGLACNNPDITIADANIKISQSNMVTAKNAWLGALNVASNVNEFVIDGTRINGVAASTYYPKYNFGLSVPLDIFSRTKGAKAVATQDIVIAKAMKDERLRIIKQEVLTRYENYKQQKELTRLQKILTEEDNDFYIAAQKSYADGTIQLNEMNKTYQSYIISQTKLVGIQHDLNVAIIELEEMIGVPVDQVLSTAASDNISYGH